MSSLVPASWRGSVEELRDRVTGVSARGPHRRSGLVSDTTQYFHAELVHRHRRRFRFTFEIVTGYNRNLIGGFDV